LLRFFRIRNLFRGFSDNLYTMAKTEEEDKKPGEGGPPNEAIFGKQERDPDEAVFAEQAILAYAHWVLEQVGPQLEGAMETAANWFLSQPEAQLLDNMALLESEGKVVLSQMSDWFGGDRSPVAQLLIPELASRVDFASRDGQAQSFFAEMKSALRDSCWYLRDNLQQVLNAKWDELRDLAYEGNREFIPVIHKLGLPKPDLDVQGFADKMIKEGEAFKKTVPQQKEEATKDQPEEKKAEGEEKAADDEKTADQAKDILEEESKKAAS
jgi:hypothetical protein